MVGIVSYGAYIPKYRISRDLIAQGWGKASMGERSVASVDEDSITMAVEACFNCLSDSDFEQVNGLYFASTSSPFREKQASALIATVLALRKDMLTADFGNTLRAATNALKAGVDAIQAKSAKRILVTAAERRLAVADSMFEQSLGDGAATFLLGDSDIAVDVIGSYSMPDEFTYYWRTDQDEFVRSWEERYSNEAGYMRIVPQAVAEVLKKYNLEPQDFAKLVLYANNPRQHVDMARRLGFDAKTQLADLLFNVLGNTGTALVPMMLIATLEEAKAGDKILVVNFSDGCDVLILKVTENIEKLRGKRGIKIHLASKAMIDRYQTYETIRGLVSKEAHRWAAGGQTSLPMLWRDRRSFLSFFGSKCRRCGQIMHPIQRVCYTCRSKDDYEEVRLARIGKIFTYCEDWLAPTILPPLISCVIMLDDGCKVNTRLTDSTEAAEKPLGRPTKLNMPVEMTFRKMNEYGGIPNYYWTARPIRGGE